MITSKGEEQSYQTQNCEDKEGNVHHMDDVFRRRRLKAGASENGGGYYAEDRHA